MGQNKKTKIAKKLDAQNKLADKYPLVQDPLELAEHFRMLRKDKKFKVGKGRKLIPGSEAEKNIKASYDYPFTSYAEVVNTEGVMSYHPVLTKAEAIDLAAQKGKTVKPIQENLMASGEVPKLRKGLDTSGNIQKIQSMDAYIPNNYTIDAKNIQDPRDMQKLESRVGSDYTLDTKTLKQSQDPMQKAGDDPIAKGVGSAGPWGKAIQAVAGVGEQAGESTGGEAGEAMKATFKPYKNYFNKDLSGSERLVTFVNPIGGGILAARAKKEKQIKAEEKEQRLLKAQTFREVRNTQADVYEDGVFGAGMTKPVEVEKDELVLRKNALGKYSLVADFKGGKTHGQGGEDYVIEEGDIVFPGKKRSTIMKYLKNGNNEGIESERLRLPKDVPDENTLKKGVDTTRKDKWEKIIDDAVKEGEFTKEEGIQIKNEVLGTFENTAPSRENLGMLLKGEYREKPKYTYRDAIGLDDSYSPLSFEDIWGDSTTATPLSKDKNIPESVKTAAEKSQGSKGVKEALPTLESREDMDYKTNKGLRALIEDSPDINMSLRKSSPDSITQSTAKTDLEQESEVRAMTEGGSKLDDILDYAPAAINIIRGMQEPERVRRRFIRPETVQYHDVSDVLRRESDIQARVDMEVAERMSGGSAQVARAGKMVAGAEGFRRRQRVDAAETARADQIAQGNVQIKNQADMQNINLATQYDTMDAQNKAAIDAYFDRGVHDFGRISRQQTIDKQKEKMQDMALEMMRSENFGYTGKGVEYLKD